MGFPNSSDYVGPSDPEKAEEELRQLREAVAAAERVIEKERAEPPQEEPGIIHLGELTKLEGR